MLSWQVLRKLGVSLNMENHRDIKHTGNTQTPPRGDKADFAPARLKSYQQGRQLTGPAQTGIRDPAWTGAKKVAIFRQTRLLRENAHTTNNKQQLDLSNYRNCRHPTNFDGIRRWTNLEAEMEINIHEELRAFWKRDREEKEHDESAMDDTLQDEVLSPASCRQTDLFDWGSPTPGVTQDIIAATLLWTDLTTTTRQLP
jgi:hypothetical protein